MRAAVGSLTLTKHSGLMSTVSNDNGSVQEKAHWTSTLGTA